MDEIIGRICLRHISQIKRGLQIGNVESSQSAWAVTGDDEQEGTQIDLLIERKDNVVNMCEMKFYSDEYSREFVHFVTFNELFEP